MNSWRQRTPKGYNKKKRTIQRNWQHWAHKTQDEDKENKKHATIRQQIQTLENHLNEGIPLQMSYYTYVFLFTYTYISQQQTRV
jgi:hypothetical protein